MDDTPTPIAEIDHGPSKFEAFLDENQKLIITAAIAIFLGVLGYVGFTGYNEMLNAQAGEDLTAANDEVQLQAVVSAHGNTASAAAAALLIADIKGNESTEDAINALRDFIASYPSHPAIPTATTSLGLRLLNEGKLAEAEEQLAAVLDMENAEHIAPVAQIGLGDIAHKNGNIESAKDFYTAVTNLISDDSSDIDNITKFSPYKNEATNRLRFIAAAAPTEVEKKIADVAPANQEMNTAAAPSNTAVTAATTKVITAVSAEKKPPVEEKDEKNSQSPE